MEQVAVRLLRWCVVLGMLVALPALAIKDKWGDIAALFSSEVAWSEVAENALAEGAALLPIQPPAENAPNRPSEMLKPVDRPDHFEAEGYRESEQVSAQSPEMEMPDRPMRDLRSCVYRPLGSGEDQMIRRVPAVAEQLHGGLVR